MQVSTADLKRVAKALWAAIADRRRETKGRPTWIFFDADVLIPGVYPTRQLERELRKDIISDAAEMLDAVAEWRPNHPLEAVVRSLWASGYMCKAMVLVPHLDEFLSVADEEEKRRALSMDVRRRIAREVLERIRAISDLPSIEAGSFSAIAQALTLRDYVLLEAAMFPTWSARRAYIQASFDIQGHHGRESDALLETDPQIATIFATIAAAAPPTPSWRARRPSREEGMARDRNYLSDAIAMASLCDLVVHRPSVSIRFYTNTGHLLPALGMPEWRQRVRDPDEVAGLRHTGDDAVDDPNGPVRSPLYMYLRSIVPSLAMPRHRVVDKGGVTALPLEELQAMCLGIDHLLETLEPEAAPGSSQPLQQRAFIEMCLDAMSHDAVLHTWLAPDNPVFESLKAIQHDVMPEVSFDLEQWRETAKATIRSNLTRIRDQRSMVQLVADHFRIVIDAFRSKRDGPEAKRKGWLAVSSGAARWMMWVPESSKELVEAEQRLVGLFGSSMDEGAAVVVSPQGGIRDRLMYAIASDIGGADYLVERIIGGMRVWKGSEFEELAAQVLLIKSQVRSSGTVTWGQLRGHISSLAREVTHRMSRQGSDSRWVGVACAVAWLSFYWCHTLLAQKETESNEGLVPLATTDSETGAVVNIGLRLLESAYPSRQSAGWKRGMGRTVCLLLAAWAHDEDKGEVVRDMIADAIVGDGDETGNPYWLEGKAWYEFVQAVKPDPRLVAALAYREFIAREERIVHELRVSREGYWDEHLSTMKRWSAAHPS